MNTLSTAQRHAIASFFESLLVAVGPALLIVLVTISAQVSACPTVAPGPGLPIPPCTINYHVIVLVATMGILQAAIRGLQGWLVAKHAPVIQSPAIASGTPTVAAVQAAVFVTPATPVAAAPVEKP